MNKNLIPKKSQELAVEVLDFCASIQEITITTADEYQQAGELTKKIIGYSKRMEAEQKEIIKPLKEIIDPVNNQISEIKTYFKQISAPLSNMENRFRQAMKFYHQACERKRIEEQRRLDAEAEKERLRLAEEARKAAQKSQKAAEKGDLEEATRHHEVAINKQQLAESIDVAPVQTEAPKVEGISYRENWRAKIMDSKAFIKYCLDSDNLQFLVIDIAALHKLAQSTKGKMKLPGIDFFDDSTPVITK